MGPATKKRKLNGAHTTGEGGSLLDPLAPVTAEERAAWPGFCEIESNPVCSPKTTLLWACSDKDRPSSM